VANVSLNRQTKKIPAYVTLKTRGQISHIWGPLKPALMPDKNALAYYRISVTLILPKKKSKKRQLKVITKRIRLRAGLLSCGKKNTEQEKGEQR
jgi:hypothetical protein